MEQFFPIILLALLVVLLFVLPSWQRKRMRAQTQAMQEALTIGTPVMTTGGLYGTVAAVAETTVDLEIAPGIVVTFARPGILQIREPVGTVRDDGTDSGSPGTAGGRPTDGPL